MPSGEGGNHPISGTSFAQFSGSTLEDLILVRSRLDSSTFLHVEANSVEGEVSGSVQFVMSRNWPGVPIGFHASVGYLELHLCLVGRRVLLHFKDGCASLTERRDPSSVSKIARVGRVGWCWSIGTHPTRPSTESKGALVDGDSRRRSDATECMLSLKDYPWRRSKPHCAWTFHITTVVRRQHELSHRHAGMEQIET